MKASRTIWKYKYENPSLCLARVTSQVKFRSPVVCSKCGQLLFDAENGKVTSERHQTIWFGLMCAKNRKDCILHMLNKDVFIKILNLVYSDEYNSRCTGMIIHTSCSNLFHVSCHMKMNESSKYKCRSLHCQGQHVVCPSRGRGFGLPRCEQFCMPTRITIRIDDNTKVVGRGEVSYCVR